MSQSMLAFDLAKALYVSMSVCVYYNFKGNIENEMSMVKPQSLFTFNVLTQS